MKKQIDIAFASLSVNELKGTWMLIIQNVNMKTTSLNGRIYFVPESYLPLMMGAHVLISMIVQVLLSVK